MRALGGVALALVLAGCIQDNAEETDPGIRETGYLSCRDGVAACGAQWSCVDADGAEVCVPPADGCDAPTCACAGEALCGSRACLDVEGGVECGRPPGPDFPLPPDAGRLDAGPPDASAPDMDPPNGDDADVPRAWTLGLVAGDAPRRIRVRGGAYQGIDDRVVVRFVVQQDGRVPTDPVTVLFRPVGDSDVAFDVPEAVTDAAGEVSVRVQGGTRSGVARIAAILDVPGPMVISEHDVEVLAGPPSAAQLRLSCADPVLPAFLAGGAFAAEPPSTPCQALVADRFGNLVEGAQVDFWTEAGDVRRLELPQPPGLATGDLLAQAPPPVDVAPAGPSRNDGLVTVVAVVRGEERFTDLDGNGVFDEGIDLFEPEDDLSEPYVDSNGNGAWDEGEPWGDENGSDAWDTGNGRWDRDAQVWAATTVLWVGVNDEAAGGLDLDCAEGCTLRPPECPGADFRLEPGGAVNVRARFADANGNCIGGDDGAMTVESMHPDVVGPEAAFPLGQTCFSDGAPGARPLEATLTDLGPAAAERALYAVEVVATYRRADGENERVVRTLTGCR